MLRVPRGRPPEVSDDRLLAELLLQPDRAVYSGEIANHVDVGQESVRQRLRTLEDDGLVQIDELESHNIYRLTPEGYEHVSSVVRAALS